VRVRSQGGLGSWPVTVLLSGDVGGQIYRVDWWELAAVFMAKGGHIVVSLLGCVSSTKSLKPSGHYMYRTLVII
jgi:hypothetical protein